MCHILPPTPQTLQRILEKNPLATSLPLPLLVPTFCVGTHYPDALRHYPAAERQNITFPRRAWERGK